MVFIKFSSKRPGSDNKDAVVGCVLHFPVSTEEVAVFMDSFDGALLFKGNRLLPFFVAGGRADAFVEA